MKAFRIKSILWASMVTAASIFASGCGNIAFVPNQLCSLQSGAGYYYVAPKIDLALVTDNTGSMGTALDQLRTQMPSLLHQLEASGWDYRFANIGLTAPLGQTGAPVSQIIPSKFDGNWFSLGQWRAVFPGATPSNPIPVRSSLFRTQDNYSGFFTNADVNTSVNSSEDGFRTIYQSLNTSRGENFFVRSGSYVVTLVVGNGNDSTDVTYYNNGANQYVPNPTSLSSSFATWKANLQSLASNPSLYRMYSVVSPLYRSSCAGIGGSSADAGTRYIDMAAATGGFSYDICTQPIASALSDLSNQLQVTREAYRTRYVVISQQPVDTSTIQEVRRTTGCDDANGNLIPQSATNGWTYAGYITNQPAIDSPIPLNPVSGYAIELHGSAKLQGDETLRVIYTRTGAQSAN